VNANCPCSSSNKLLQSVSWWSRCWLQCNVFSFSARNLKRLNMFCVSATFDQTESQTYRTTFSLTLGIFVFQSFDHSASQIESHLLIFMTWLNRLTFDWLFFSYDFHESFYFCYYFSEKHYAFLSHLLQSNITECKCRHVSLVSVDNKARQSTSFVVNTIDCSGEISYHQYNQ